MRGGVELVTARRAVPTGPATPTGLPDVIADHDVTPYGDQRTRTLTAAWLMRQGSTHSRRAYAIAHLKQGESGWTGQISGGEGAIAVRMVDLFHLRQRLIEKYGKVSF